MRMGSPPVSWGVIGFGDVVRRKSGPALLADPGARIAAVARASGDVTEAAEALNCRGCGTIEDLLDDAEVEAIYIATPPHTHEALVMRSLGAGKPIVVEKPLAPDAASAQRMVDAAQAAGVSLSVAYYRRCNPRLHRIRSMIRAGMVGEVQTVEIRQLRSDGDRPLASWRGDPSVTPGGRLSDSHVHALDWLRHAFGPHQAVTGGVRAAGRGEMVAYGLKLPEALAAGVFHANAVTAEDSIIVHGEEGEITAPFFDPGPIVVRREDGEISQDVPEPKYGHQPFFEAMGRHIRDGAPSPCPAAEAVGAAEIIDRLITTPNAAHVAAE
ncbi:MAG: Gfo/Idh/MocA family oxidoreductase [Pseudomonadota bacterium]